MSKHESPKAQVRVQKPKSASQRPRVDLQFFREPPRRLTWEDALDLGQRLVSAAQAAKMIEDHRRRGAARAALSSATTPRTKRR